MPYRRLPNTDLARIYALQKAVEMEGFKENGELVLSYLTIQDASQLLNVFRRAQQKYQQCYNLQSKSSKLYRVELHTARLYVSHFIQVLNMSIMRGEYRKEIKTDYGLNTEDYNSPDLTSEQAVYEWGERIIKAEEVRTAKGGVPIYNPTIAKVKVHYNIFAEHYYNQKMLRTNAAKALEEVTKMRPAVDDLILDIWNQVESIYGHLPTEEKLEKCRAFGIIYYYRTKEKARQKAAEMQKGIEF